MFKLFVVSLTLTVCMVSCAPTTVGPKTTPFVKLSCHGHPANGFFVDEKDPTVFHQCSHGQHIATFHCQPLTVFDETAQVCVRTHDEVCPQPDGLFPVSGNVHKFLDCFKGHGTVKSCSGDLVFNPTKHECDYNDKGDTWPTDPTIAAPTTSPPTGTTGSAGTTAKAGTTGSAGTIGTTVKAACDYKGNKEDPDNKHKYFNCHNGKLLHETCSEDEVFNKVTKQCE